MAYAGIGIRLRTALIGITISLTVNGSVLTGGENMDSIIDVLGREISATADYRAAKEARLKALKGDLYNADGDLNFNVAADIFKEYSAYQSDSAFHYATVMRRDAEARNIV